MSDYFFDSSALAKRYISEVGSVWVGTITGELSNNIYVASITSVEIVAALARRVKGGTLLAADADAADNALQTDFSVQYIVSDISSAIIKSAMNLARQHALRGYDAVQLATAVDANQEHLSFGLPPIIIVSADDELNNAAQAEGLEVENPNHHP
jgi:uncharacterized protein